MASSGSPIRKIGAVVVAGVAYGAYKLGTGSSLVSKVFTGPGSTSRIVALVVVVANCKNLPFVWHYRVWKAIVQQFAVSKRSFAPSAGPAALFLPVITRSISPATECDYNLHKSNSTYFTDLDVSRSHLFGVLFCKATKRLQNERNLIYVDGKPHNGTFSIALGAVHCSFKKEIKPYEGYEMWTRVLAWDRKWLYFVTHFVKQGAVRPAGYMNDDGSIVGNRKAKNTDNGASAATADASKFVFATAVSKYVVKLGRLTIHPETYLEYSSLLPSRPGGWNTMTESSSQDGSASISFEKVDAANDDAKGQDECTWQRIVTENEKGLEFANHFAAMDELHSKFSDTGKPALGVYTDLLF